MATISDHQLVARHATQRVQRRWSVAPYDPRYLVGGKGLSHLVDSQSDGNASAGGSSSGTANCSALTATSTQRMDEDVTLDELADEAHAVDEDEDVTLEQLADEADAELAVAASSSGGLADAIPTAGTLAGEAVAASSGSSSKAVAPQTAGTHATTRFRSILRRVSFGGVVRITLDQRGVGRICGDAACLGCVASTTRPIPTPMHAFHDELTRAPRSRHAAAYDAKRLRSCGRATPAVTIRRLV